MKIILVGNPNAGKTTLFNSLTGKNEKVGNWHGVTIEEKTASYVYRGEKYDVSDVPGLYSLKNCDAEEAEAARSLSKNDYDAIVAVVEADKVKRGLKLVSELRRFNKPIVLFINLYADFLKRNGNLNAEELGKATGTKVICGEACFQADARKIKEYLADKPVVLPVTESEYDYKQPRSRGYTLDKIITGKFSAVPIFASAMLAIFYLAFGNFSPITALSEAISRLLTDFIGKRIYYALYEKNLFIARLISEGILGGIAAVFSFIPQIAVLSLCLEFLDQSGYLSRLSASTDGFLRKFGLSGKSVYCLSCGFGCTALSATCSKGIDDPPVKRRAVLSLPFISCSARTPVYFYIAKFVFKKYAFAVVTVVYFLSLILPTVHSAVLKKFFVKGEPQSLITELADLKMPKLSALLKSLLKTLKEFIIKLSTVVFSVTLAAWLALSVSPNLQLLEVTECENSILAYLGKGAAFLFKPMGLDWKYSVSVVSGLFAKESVVSLLSILFPDGLILTVPQGISLTAFCYLCPPCITAFFAVAKETNAKNAIISWAWQLILALLVSYALYFVFTWIL